MCKKNIAQSREKCKYCFHRISKKELAFFRRFDILIYIKFEQRRTEACGLRKSPQAEWGAKPREAVTVMPERDESDTPSCCPVLCRHRSRNRRSLCARFRAANGRAVFLYPNGDKKRQKSGEQSMKQPIIDENAPGHFVVGRTPTTNHPAERSAPALGLYI